VVPGGPSRPWMRRMANEYGEGSPTYVARVEGEFPQEAEDALCERAWLEAAFDRHGSGEPRGRLVVAVDPARYGSDETVVCAGRWPVVVRLEGWRGKALTETAGRAQIIAEELCGDSRHALYAVDEPGVGSGVVDALKEQQLKVKPYNGGRKAGEGRRYFNVRAQSFWALRRLLERGEIAVPRDEKLLDELCSMRWRTNSAGLVQIEPKDKLRTRIGRSPDRSDSLAIWCRYARTETATRLAPVSLTRVSPWKF
jgi:hypothetical protein